VKTAVVVLSRAGLDLARRLREAHPEATSIFGPSCVVGMCRGAPLRDDDRMLPILTGAFEAGEPGVFGWKGPLRVFFPNLWEQFEAIVAIMAVGIVVRLVGPLVSDKRRDPAVIAIDDAGRFAISVLGGHGAGANSLTHELAIVINAEPIVTTASDTYRLPAVDQIGREWRWSIERTENLTSVAASIMRRERVVVWQDAGSRDWWQSFGPWPDHFIRLGALSEWGGLQPAALLIISDSTLPCELPADRTLVYRPPTLVAGIGCRRGTSRETIASWFAHVFAAQGLAEASLSAVATVTLKADEPGLVDFAAARRIPLLVYAPEELDGQPGIETPSERVRAKIGIAAVAEPAALRAAGATRLLVSKQTGPGVTLAVARRLDDVAIVPSTTQ